MHHHPTPEVPVSVVQDVPTPTGTPHVSEIEVERAAPQHTEYLMAEEPGTC